MWQEEGKARSYRRLTFCVQEFGSISKNGNHWGVSNGDANYEGLKLESSVCCSKDATVLGDVKGESNLCNSLCL